MPDIEYHSMEKTIREIRMHLVELSHRGRTPHLGSSLSCVDLLAVLYEEFLNVSPADPFDENRDRFFLSKGHAVTALYSILSRQGFCSKADLDTNYNRSGSCFPEHPSRFCIPGVEASTGSLGHGLGLGIGVCCAHRIRNIESNVFVMLSDGECNEGSVWEAAMMAAAQKLSHLCAIIDVNKWQATGRSSEVLALEPLEQKFAAFGWRTIRIDGHDIQAIRNVYQLFLSEQRQPFAIIADTVKGKGISFMEDDNNWHYRIPSEEELLAARKELNIDA